MFRFLITLMLLVSINVSGYSLAATPSGTRISNQAEASYQDSDSGEIIRLVSNVASLTVATQLAVDVTNEHNQRVTIGQPVYLSHNVINTGNQADAYDLSALNLSDDNGDLTNIKIYLDENGDGQVNPGELQISRTDTLKPNERIQLVITGTVPNSASVGDQFLLNLSATSTSDDQVTDQTKDTLTVSDGAIIRLTRRTDTDCQIVMAVNDTSYHEITFTNIGNDRPPERELTVGDITVQGLLIEQTIDEHFQLLKEPDFFVEPSQGLLVVANQLGEWSEYANWDGRSSISKLGVIIPVNQIKPNQTGRFGYTLRVDKLPEQQTSIDMAATLDLEGDGRADASSNASCNTLQEDDPVSNRDDYVIEGTVFDSSTLTGIADARVELIYLGAAPDTTPDNSTAKQALLAAKESIAATVSAADGSYRFSELSAGRYHINITPPAEYVAPSVYPPQQFTTYNVQEPSYGLLGYQAADNIDTASEAGAFVMTSEAQLFELDIPVDPKDNSSDLVIEKTVSTDEVAIGELLAYTIRIGNRADQALYASKVVDWLPAGFKYLKGTAKLDGEYIDDPTVEVESGQTKLTFRVSNHLEEQAEHSLNYVVQVTALAQNGENTNTAMTQANTISGALVASTRSNARVNVSQTGVLSDRAILFGRIAMEKGCEVGTEEQQAQGYPLAGVRLYMEDGTYVITDHNGQYSLYGLQPGVHVLKIDGHTVPEGVKFKLKDVAQAGATDSRFVDLLPGDFQRADFTAACPKPIERTIKECHDPDPIYKEVEECVAEPVVSSKTEWVTRTIPNPIQPIQFVSGQSAIPPAYIQKLKRLIEMTQDKRNVRFKFVGHTDNERLKPATQAKYGTNRGLSEARAQEVAEYVLQRLDIKSQVQVAGKGDTQPVASNDTPAGMARNRRVELLMLYDEAVEKETKSTKQVCKTRKVVDRDEPEGCTSKTVTEPSPVIKRLLSRSKTALMGWGSEVERIDPANADNLKNLSRFADQNGDISNGLIEAHTKQKQSVQEDFARQQAAEPDKPEAEIPKPKQAVKDITQEQAKTGTWLWPLDDTSLDGRFVVVVRSGVDPVLSVNGEKVSNAQLGEQIVNKREKAQIMAWYGVELQEGENHLKITAKDPFGNLRTLAEKNFKRPSSGVAINLSVDGTLTADRGRSTVPVNIEILDSNNYPAKGTYFVTVEASDGSWVEPDIQDKVPGHQIKVTNGSRTIHLRSSAQSGRIKLTASTGKLQSETDLTQVAELRPLVAVGLLDLRAHQGYASGYENLGLQQLDPAQEDIEISGRAALFMKGRVRNDMHLTLAYDSEKDEEAELLRDLDPAEYYRVYGDASVRGFEAQSRSQLYAKLEKDRHSVMWGDYITDNDSNTADIARIQRTLTGLNAIYNDGRTRVQTFASEQDNLRGIEIIPGNGTAMQYQLSGAPIVRHSEVVELITRDRENAGLILDTEQLQRFRDYSIDEVSGYLEFHRPIPSVDDDLNPVFIRISYDQEEESDNYLVAGVRILHQFTDELSAGASYTKDAHHSDGYQIAGAYANYETENTQIEAGIARMEHADNSDSGNAVRIQANHRWSQQARTEFTAAQADAGFDNNSGVIADRREIKLSHQQQLSKDLEAKAEVTHSESMSTEQERQTAELSLNARVDDWRLKGGVRQLREADASTEDKANTVIVGVERDVEIMGRKGNVQAEYEREIGDADRQRASIGADMQLTDKTKAYVRYEQSDRLASGTLSGAVETQNSLVAGVEAQVLPSTELYSEYRIDGDITGEDVVAVNGAKATLNLEDDLVLTPSIEYMNYLEGSEKRDSIAASLGYKDTRNKDAKKLLRLETRHSDDEEFYGAKGTYVQKLSDTTTVMVQDELRYKSYDDEREKELQNTLTIAAAHRPAGNGNYNALYAYEWDLDDAANKNTHIASTHQHYRINEELDLSGRFGAKQQILKQDNVAERSNAMMADARAQWELSDRLSLDLHGGVLATDGGNEQRYAFGTGVSYNFMDNVRLGVGYNFTGFEDNDLDPSGLNAKGAYIGLQFKADEALFGWLSGDEKRLDRCDPERWRDRDIQRPADCNNN